MKIIKKNFQLVFAMLLSFIAYQQASAQGTDCFTADPFCSGTTYDFPNVTGVNHQSGPDYGCVQNAKNPAWYYMKIAEDGPMSLNIKQTSGPNGSGSGLDVDFAIWGPFPDENSGCDGVMNGQTAPIQSSYSTASVETIGLGVQGGSNSICGSSNSVGATTPPAAIKGEYYLVMVTNYSNNAGYITLQQTNENESGAGMTDCSIVSCDVNDLTATTVCNGDNITITGSVKVSTNIDQGTLVITSACGQTTTYHPPFPSTPTEMPFSFDAGPADGQTCEIKAYFTEDPSCEKVINITKSSNPDAPNIYNTPASCSEDGTGKITNYNTAFNYTFTPSGPQINADGSIANAAFGTEYAVKVSNEGCESDPVTFTIDAQTPPPAGPEAESPQAFCDNAWVEDLTASGINLAWYDDKDSLIGLDAQLNNGSTYYVSQTINGCESEKTPVAVVINSSPTIDAGEDKTVCKGRTASLKANGAVNYVWSPAAGLNVTNNATVLASPQETTTYIVKGVDANGCVGYDTVTVFAVDAPTPSFVFAPDSLMPPMEVTFTNTSTDANSFIWDFGNGDVSYDASGVTTIYNEPGNYTATLTASNGYCNDFVQQIVTVLQYPDPTIEVPNVFTPNGDGMNDHLFVKTTNVKDFEMVILNRWGNLMYTLKDVDDMWNGGKAADGVYFYKYIFKDFNDKEYQGHGYFHLVR